MANFTHLAETLFENLPPQQPFQAGIRRAPSRGLRLSKKDIRLALKNALRYIPKKHHAIMAPEFLEELQTMGRIYGYRFRPTTLLKGKPIEEYKGITEAKALQVMIDNNLDFEVALYPYELVTYGETGQVCQNWMQYQFICHYLQNMTQDQTLVVASGHPLGLFPSRPESPRAIVTNGLMLGMFDNPEEFHRAAAIGVANYGQMTAGGWMYIGPQGIVHGTYITLLNAGRQYLGIPDDGDLKGKLFVTSGLGGMSGAQPKAVEIAGGIGIIAEVDYSRIQTRLDQGWINCASSNMEEIFNWVDEARQSEKPLSIAYHGNVVDLLEYIADHKIKAELISDQTSCHAVYEGGYIPQGVSFDEARILLAKDQARFAQLVDQSLIRHFQIIKKLTAQGSFFWDYGNSFMKAVFDAGDKSISLNGIDTREGFIYPSYVEDIMGPVCFDYGYGPFRWVALSGKPEDLRKTDQAAMNCIDPNRRGQDRDNYIWIRDAEKNQLVVGTQARILYADAEGRVRIALRFNEMVRNGEIGPIMMGRDHHDTQGTDSPYRETANIHDGSNIMSDMAHHCFAGNIARGMTLVVLSNGGGVGTGKVINGGNGIVLDGSTRIDQVLRLGLDWDVMGGVARRSWARNPNAIETVDTWNQQNQDRGHITIPELVEDSLLDQLLYL